MKGILLDTINQEIKEVDCANDIHEWYKLLNTDIVEMPERQIGGKYYTIICDEEGLLKPEPIISAMNSGIDTMFVGNLLIFNIDRENCDVTDLSKEDIENIKSFTKVHTFVNTKTGEEKKFLIIRPVEY